MPSPEPDDDLLTALAALARRQGCDLPGDAGLALTLDALGAATGLPAAAEDTLALALGRLADMENARAR